MAAWTWSGPKRVKTFCFVTGPGRPSRDKVCNKDGFLRQGWCDKVHYNNAARHRFETKPARQGLVTERGGRGPATTRGIDPSPNFREFTA